MVVSTGFAKAYQALNEEQRIAVDTLDGPVMVVAGPGTGKTQTIALRIANILKKTDTDPDAILALTFTESGARAMRERLIGLIGTAAYYCNISTFHSFCMDVIKDNPDAFVIDPAAEPLSDLEKLKRIYRLLDKTRLNELRPVGAPHHYARAILRAVSDLKREGVSPDELREILREEQEFLNSGEAVELKKAEITSRTRNLKKNRELAELYETYQKELKKEGRFDFDDMINSVAETLRTNRNLLATLQERFQYFLVDEYQDTNSAQNALLMTLAAYWGEKANVFVVGDPDQSIYRFQGASIENQLSFMKIFPQAKVITLKENYRSTQTILDAAAVVIEHNNLRIDDVVVGTDLRLLSASGPGEKIYRAAVSSSTAEAICVAEDIRKKIEGGASPRDIAIIYRTNGESRSIADTLVKYGLDYTVQGGANVLEDATVRNLLKIFRVIYEMRIKDDDEDLFTILHYDIFGVDPLDVLRLSRLASDKRLSLFDVMTDPQLLSSLNLRYQDKLEHVLSLLTSWQQLDANVVFTEFFETVLNKSGYLTWVLGQPDSHHRLSRLNTLFDEVKRMNRFDKLMDLKGFLTNLDLMEENHLRIEESDFGKSKEAVTLTTAHSAKGLEWGHVYIFHATDGVWGNNKNRELITLPEGLIKNTKLSEKEKNEDERRLFYVAMTRAKKTLTITRADAYTSYGKSRPAAPTMFLEEVGDAHMTKVDVTDVEEEAHAHMEKLLTSPPTPDMSEDEIAFLTPLAEKFSLSVTALNTYLSCAYLFKLDKLLKVPHAKKPHLAFGTAVHKALELFYKKLKEDGTRPTKDFLLETFHTALKKEVIGKKDLENRLAQGDKILSAYYDFHLDDVRPPLFLERFSRVHMTDGLRDITLTGKIDRIEWSDESDRLIRVIDYKTGKGKTAGQIEGTTADSSGDLKRQLIFYKLLIDLDTRLKVHFGEAELDFVEEPAVSNKDGIRRFKITDEEVVELKKVILDAMKEIRALHFPRTKNYKTCETCVFRDHCWPEGIPVA